MADFPLGFEKAEERTNFIRDNADLYAITWYSNYKYHKFWYSTLEKARRNAQVAANHLNKHIMIYGIMFPFSDYHGPDSWVETVEPYGDKHHSSNKLENT